jgi:hypothetical protein
VLIILALIAFLSAIVVLQFAPTSGITHTINSIVAPMAPATP